METADDTEVPDSHVRRLALADAQGTGTYRRLRVHSGTLFHGSRWTWRCRDEILDILHKDGPQTEVDYRAAWARTHLKMIGTIDNTARGVWTITDTGRDVQSEEQVRELVRSARADRLKAKKPKGARAPERKHPRRMRTRPGRDALLGNSAKHGARCI